MGTFAKHPSVAEATKVGEPTLVDPTPMSASQVTQAATRAAMGVGTGTGSQSVSVETVKGTPGPDQPAPRSDAPIPPDAAAANNSAAADASAPPAVGQPDPNELKPDAAPADPNELKPNVSGDSGQALPPPQQVNEIQTGATAPQPAGCGTSPAVASDGKSAASSASASTDQSDDTDATVASSKHKKKKGIHKVVPF